MLEKLSQGLKNAINKITKTGYVNKEIVEDLAKDIKKTLLAGDVNVKLADSLTNKIKDRALNEKPPKGLTAKEHLIKIVYDELVKFVGEKPEIMMRRFRI